MKNRNGLLYLATARCKSSGYILPSMKVGITSDTVGRERQLNGTKMPIEVELTHVFCFDDADVNNVEAEQICHTYLARHRLSGEWFSTENIEMLADKITALLDFLGAELQAEKEMLPHKTAPLKLVRSATAAEAGMSADMAAAWAEDNKEN